MVRRINGTKKRLQMFNSIVFRFLFPTLARGRPVIWKVWKLPRPMREKRIYSSRMVCTFYCLIQSSSSSSLKGYYFSMKTNTLGKLNYLNFVIYMLRTRFK